MSQTIEPDYEIVDADGATLYAAPWRWACPEREPDGFTLPAHVAEAWREGVHAYATIMRRLADDIEQIGQLRYTAERLVDFANHLATSADIWERFEREAMATHHLQRARWRRLTGVEVARFTSPTRRR